MTAATPTPSAARPAKPQEGPSPFVHAKVARRRAKLLLWGEAGSGKTTLALEFPKPALIDLEGGADLYGGGSAFDVMRASTADEVAETIRWLHRRAHSYETLILDPVTVYWEALQRKWSDIFLRRNTNSRGHRHEFYDFQPKDWLTLKSEFKAVIRGLLALDMHVVLIAREKVQYADDGLMRPIGTTFDCERSIAFVVDAILRLRRERDGKYVAETIKDRSGALPPGEFEPSIEALRRFLNG